MFQCTLGATTSDIARVALSTHNNPWNVEMVIGIYGVHCQLSVAFQWPDCVNSV